MYHRDGRGQSDHQDSRSRSPRGHHPNWAHPGRDACGTGFIARLGGAPSYDIIQFALTALERLTHRGGVDADGASGDGAGLLTSLPQAFFRARAQEQGIELPEIFAVGFAFLPSSAVEDARASVEAAADTERLRIIGWRRVPVNTNSLGRRALETMPEIWQFFVEPFHPARAAARFEWRLALLRKRAESLLPPRCYICSLSSQTIVYKGLLTPWQFPQFYEDLRDPSFAATFAVFHQRYSTNTQPSWHLAQPFRYVAHNGEINTIVSNRRWLRAKAAEIRSRLTVGSWFPLLEEDDSPSASFDNGFELRLLEGLSSEEAMLAMVPPAFQKDPLLSRDVRGALTAISQQSEPWDGPAALVFSDGQFVGAKLDRNGLRPLRYTLTHDGLLIAGSETGLVDLEESRIAERQRLGPGEMILANPATGLFLRWRDILKRLAIQQLRDPPVMSLDVHLKDGITLPSPLISAGQLSQLSAILGPEQRIDITFSAATGVPGARCSFAQLSTTPLSGSGRPGLLLLSDLAIDPARAPLPALLATPAVWRAMVREGLWDVPLIVESAQVFDTHHVALLVAAGASAVVPYLADEFAESLEPGGMEKARAAINAGLRKVLARMAVSTLASYRNSH